MSKGPWQKEPFTGQSMRLFERADDSFQTNDSALDTRSLSDCDIFCVNSFAVCAGFRDTRHFVNKVLRAEDSPFHFHEFTITDVDSRYLARAFGTHTNSARAGAAMWRERQARRAADRARQVTTDVRSLSTIQT
jgi:hypothetical protein